MAIQGVSMIGILAAAAVGKGGSVASGLGGAVGMVFALAMTSSVCVADGVLVIGSAAFMEMPSFMASQNVPREVLVFDQISQPIAHQHRVDAHALARFFVVSVAGLTTSLGVYRINVVAPAAGFIQNGSPDAVALVRFGPSTVVLDGFSYEGSTAAAAFTGVAGTFAVTEGAGHAGSDPGATITDCVARVPNGRDTDNNSTDFVSRATCTPGAPN